MSSSRPRIALVLSGGGSRGAYEAGVILYLRDQLEARLGRPLELDIITGTSVGAINATFMAATMEDHKKQGDALAALWRNQRIEDLISLKAKDLLKAGGLLMGREPPPPAPGSYRYGGLLDTTGLENTVIRHVPWRGIRRNLNAGRLRSLAVSATQVGTGHTMVFVDSVDYVTAGWSRNPFVGHRKTAISPRHALASAAIPLLFPAVKIGKSYYVDGGLRQNTPMSPALRLGADRILVISLRHDRRRTDVTVEHDREVAYPKPLFLAGKALNALLLDHTEYDFDRMNRLNAILEAGENAFGSEFTSMVNDELIKLRGAPIRRIEAVHIRPSQDIGIIASEFVRSERIDVKGRVAKTLLGRLANSEAAHEADLLSYLLFDGNFADTLIDLGYEDAKAQSDELLHLFR